MKVVDIAASVNESARQEIIGIRPGEKLHEQMISYEDAAYTYEYDDYYKILPSIHEWSSDPARINEGKKVDPGFIYSSDNNKDWMTVDQLRSWIALNKAKIGLI